MKQCDFDELNSVGKTTIIVRVINSIISELDNMIVQRDVFVIGTTNRPYIIDQAILRPGNRVIHFQKQFIFIYLMQHKISSQ